MKDLLKYSVCVLFLLAFVPFFAGCNGLTASKRLTTRQGSALGTTYTIRYEAAADAPDIKTGIESIFNRVNKSMSTYLPDSDISRINRGDSTVIADPYFREVFLKAKEIWRKSRGKFDPTAGALVNAWGFGPENALENISKRQLDSILDFTGFDKAVLSEDGRVTKAHKAVYLDFNALAKGYTADLIGRLLDEKGIENYLVEIGGEILCKGINTQTRKSWRIAIDNPLQEANERTLIARLQLTDRAIATSGNYRKFKTDANGLRYAHIIDPKTGYPEKSSILSVSVIAGTCMEADAYATAFMVMELEETKALLKQLNTVEAYIIYTGKDGALTTYATSGFEALMLN